MTNVNVGSGKKYKKCCGAPSASISNVQAVEPLSFFEKYNSTDLLQSIAGLSILKENHGKNYRFEKITEEAIMNFNVNPAITPVKELQSFLSAEYPSEPMGG